MLHKFEIFLIQVILYEKVSTMYMIYFMHFLCLHIFGKNSELFANPSFQSNIQPAKTSSLQRQHCSGNQAY